MLNKASRACQVRSAIRCIEEMPFEKMADIFKNKIPYNREHDIYFLGFFEECSPTLIHDFMQEQDISRQQILNVYYRLAKFGETHSFGMAVADGKF